MTNFTDFARAHGVLIKDLYPADKIRRCPTVEHPRSTNGAYSWDGHRGWVMCWDGDGEVHWYDDPNAKPWTPQEKASFERQQRQKFEDIRRKNERAALQAQMMLATAKVGPHDYLTRKGLSKTLGLVLPDGELFVPMRSLSNNELQGGQVIRWDGEARKWEKKMVPGMKAKGAVLRLGPKSPRETWLCEGYATGLSIEIAANLLRLSAAVLVCFSDSNMAFVAGLLRDAPGRRFVFADNDASEAGERAAKQTGLPYCMSDVVGEDANDLHMRAGLTVVAARMMAARQCVPP